MDYTVESLCNQMARNRLLAAEAIRSLRQRWRDEVKEASDDAGRFSKWLIANSYLTDFQFGMLTRGFADLLWLGEYKLLDRIGRGRMAGVYKAVHQLGQVVAVKVLPPSKAQHAPLLARFQREARLALRLKHPNVVRTFQVGKSKGDLHYLVMEYLDGEPLEDVLERRERLPPGEAAYVLLQALRGLQHLDDEGLVHRDLKPANLMLVPVRSAGQPDTVLRQTVKILDIGLGRALFDEGAPGAADVGELTNEGVILGTPNYMAPEQARNARAADIRSDLYSLGCVFYEMLTGQVPFPDDSPLRQMVRHATEPPRPLRELNPAVPENFQVVMDSLLAKDPAQRYATANQAARAVSALLPNLPEPPAPPAPGPQMNSYLIWLETRDENGAPTSPPSTPSPAPAGPALKAPAQGPVPVAAAVAVAPPAAPKVSPAAQTPVPAARPTVPVAALAPATSQSPVPPVAKLVSPAPAAALVPAAVAPSGKPLWRALFRPTRRDLLFAGTGAGLLLVLELILWVVLR
jgi:serine/threonine protein kinase